MRFFRWALAILLVGGAILHFGSRRTHQRELEGWIRSTGLETHRPELAVEIARRGDPVDARTELALALVDLELDPSWVLDLPGDERPRALAAGLERLALARRLADESVERRPLSHRAWLALGGAIYLDLARRGDPRWNTEPGLWMEPLERARRLAPHDPVAPRLLTAAQLSRWSVLDEAARRDAEELFREAFRDPRTFDLFHEQWLRVAPSLRSALRVLPDSSRAWRRIQDHFARQEDWERYCLARERWHQALDDEIPGDVAAGVRLLAGGEVSRGRKSLLAAATARRPSTADVVPLETVLATLPPGPVSRAEGVALSDWFDWSLELCAFRDCPLTESAMRRLQRLIDDPGPVAMALASLLTGDPARADLLYRRRGLDESDAWATFEAARDARVAGSAARALGDRGLVGNWRQVDSRRRSTWIVLGPREVVGPVRTRHANPAVADVYLDGDRLTCFTAYPGRDLALPADLGPGLHRVEVDMLHGRLGLAPVEIVGRP